MSRTYISAGMTKEMYARTGNGCYLCGGTDNLIDRHHVVPEYANGPTISDNLIPLCSNKLGGNSCHNAVHTIYRAREKRNGGVLGYTIYWEIVEGLRGLSGFPETITTNIGV
jgi:hypothetical protein